MSFVPTEREHYFTTRPESEPPSWFRHNGPEKPAAPDFPDGLDADEQAEVRAWQGWGATPTLPDAQAKVAEYETHNAAMAAWRIADKQARMEQWRWSQADSAILNKGVTPVSAVEGGDEDEISDPPPPYIPPQYDEP